MHVLSAGEHCNDLSSNLTMLPAFIGATSTPLGAGGECVVVAMLKGAPFHDTFTGTSIHSHFPSPFSAPFNTDTLWWSLFIIICAAITVRPGIYKMPKILIVPVNGGQGCFCCCWRQSGRQSSSLGSGGKSTTCRKPLSGQLVITIELLNRPGSRPSLVSNYLVATEKLRCFLSAI